MMKGLTGKTAGDEARSHYYHFFQNRLPAVAGRYSATLVGGDFQYLHSQEMRVVAWVSCRPLDLCLAGKLPTHWEPDSLAVDMSVRDNYCLVGWSLELVVQPNQERASMASVACCRSR